jgi:outer membrane protein TolC
LNRASDADITSESIGAVEVVEIENDIIDKTSVAQREELLQLREANAISETVLDMKQLFWSPKLSGFVDLGSQAEHWKVNNDSRYYLFGFQLDVPLFAGFTNRYKIQQAKLDLNNTTMTMANVSRQLDMSQEISRNAVRTALQNYVSANRQLEAAESYMRLIEKGYKEGVNTFIEAIDARNQLTSAQLQVSINQYRLLIAQANFERETSSFNLNQ